MSSNDKSTVTEKELLATIQSMERAVSTAKPKKKREWRKWKAVGRWFNRNWPKLLEGLIKVKALRRKR